MLAETLSHRRHAAGFSLIELLIAITVLLVGIVAVAQLVPTAMNTNFRNRYDSTSLIIAQRQLEAMMAQDMRVTLLGDPVVANGAYRFLNSSLPAATQPNQICNLGQMPPLFVAASPTAAPPPEATTGAPLAIGSLSINWAAPRVLGYANVFQTPEGYFYETRWNVTTFYGNINGSIRPVRKRIIIATRGGPARTAFPPTTLVTMVGWR